MLSNVIASKLHFTLNRYTGRDGRQCTAGPGCGKGLIAPRPAAIRAEVMLATDRTDINVSHSIRR